MINLLLLLLLLLLSRFSCIPILCNPIDSSPPGSAIPGIFQARTLAWVAISFSNDQLNWLQNNWFLIIKCKIIYF